jgi:hypothetical protein
VSIKEFPSNFNVSRFSSHRKRCLNRKLSENGDITSIMRAHYTFSEDWSNLTSNGSVEGVVSDHDPYSDHQWIQRNLSDSARSREKRLSESGEGEERAEAIMNLGPIFAVNTSYLGAASPPLQVFIKSLRSFPLRPF